MNGRVFVTKLVCYLSPSQAPAVRLPDGSGRNGVITNYSILYQLDNNVQSPEMVTTTNNSTSLALQGLIGSSVYRVMVATNTRVGRGPFSAAVTGATLHSGNSVPVCISHCVK